MVDGGTRPCPGFGTPRSSKKQFVGRLRVTITCSLSWLFVVIPRGASNPCPYDCPSIAVALDEEDPVQPALFAP